MINRRIVCREFGPPENLVLEESKIPTPGDGEVLVKISAAGVGFADSLLVQGLYQVKPELPFYPGGEFAGEVIDRGAGVVEIQEGTKVMGMASGAFSDYLCIRAGDCTEIPTGMSEEIAGGFYANYSTALFGLRDCGNLTPGETILILGASGGVGSSAVAVAKAMGARVIAGASNQQKLELALAAGADEGLLYAEPDWRSNLKSLLGKEKLDVVYDPVGGDLSETAFRSLSPGGRFLVVGFASGTIPSIPLNLPLLKQSAIVGVDWGGAMRTDRALTPALQKTLLGWIEDRRLEPAPVFTEALSNAPTALANQIGGKVIGKLVLLGGQ